MGSCKWKCKESFGHRFSRYLRSQLLAFLIIPIAVEAQFTFTTNSGAITVTGYSGSGDAVIIPDTIDGLPVTGIGDWAFYSVNATNVTIPDSVTNIGDGAFFDCEFLTFVTIGGGVSNIDDWAFAFCPSLTSIHFRGNQPSVGGTNVFYGDVNATLYYLAGTSGWSSMFAGVPTVSFPFSYAINEGKITLTGYSGPGGEVVMCHDFLQPPKH